MTNDELFARMNEGFESNHPSDNSPILSKETLQKAFEYFDHLMDENAKAPLRPPRFVIVPPWVGRPWPKPRWYKFWSKRRRLNWLKNYRSLAATLDYLGYGHVSKENSIVHL